MSLELRHQRLRLRAEMLARLRSFFAERGFLEVETPMLDREIIPELHIDPFGVDATASSRVSTTRQGSGVVAADVNYGLWLQASPELHMKRLLAEGLPAIYQVTRSFRAGERGRHHNPEFTMVEWYRAGDTMEAGIDLVDALCQAVAGAQPAQQTTYGSAFQQHAGLDPHSATCEELAAAASRLRISVPDAIRREDRDEWLNLLLASVVEPRLGKEGSEILYDYPASQSALATIAVRADGTAVAERFELYWRGVELANGYHELTDAAALRRRLTAANEARVGDFRRALPLPERLLSAMESPGLPPCSGCALGLDRLVMLAAGASSIDDVMPFPQA
jgi:lysyl-tRNA synthetase class 2